MEAEELIDLGLAADDTGKTNDADSRLIVTNWTNSCSFFTCCFLFFVEQKTGNVLSQKKKGERELTD